MTRTRTQLRRATVEQLGLPLITGTSNSTGNTTTTLKDTPDLQRFADNALIGAWIYFTGSTPSFSDCRITDSSAANGSATYRPTMDSSPNSEAYEILPFEAPAVHQALDEALLRVYDMGLIQRPMWLQSVVGSPIYNSDFSYWTSSSALDGWTANTATLSRQQGVAQQWVNANSARLGSSDGTVTLDTTWRRFLTDISAGGQSISVHAWVKSGTGSDARINIVPGSGSTSNSSYHGADSEWQLLSKEGVSIGATDMDWTVQLEGGAGNAEFNDIWIEGGQMVPEHPIPSNILPGGPTAIYISPMELSTNNASARVRPGNATPWRDWRWLKYRDEAQDVEYGIIRWLKFPPKGYRMWVEGSAPLSIPTADTSAIEVDRMESILVAKMAALDLVERNFDTSQPRWAKRQGELSRDIAILAEGRGESNKAVALGMDM
jgi:hypothetical protein